MPNIYHTLIPTQEFFPNCTFVQKKKSSDIFPNISGRAARWNADAPTLVRQMISALTERSFPAHLHSSLLVGDAGQGICNKDETHFLFIRKSHESVSMRPLQPSCAHGLRAYTRVEEVAMWFVIHFVSVYSIIHPGVPRASNSPDTACDRVQTATGLKYAWGTFVWKQNRRSRDTWAPDWRFGWRRALKVGQKEFHDAFGVNASVLTKKKRTDRPMEKSNVGCTCA